MKKLFTRFGFICLLVLSSLFGDFTNFTPVFANTDPSEPLPDELIDLILGLDSETPSNTNQSGNNTPSTPSTNDPNAPLPDDVIDEILNAGDDDRIPNDPNAPLPDDVIDDILNAGGTINGPNAPLPDDVIDEILNAGDEDENNPDENPGANPDNANTCQDQSEGLSWILCSAFGVVTKASDTIYGHIEGLLVVEPLTTDSKSAVYRVWDYMRGFTNIIFVIFLIVVIYSQITGLGINNYGIKRILPRLIIAVILVNLSYIICALLVDASNILGSGITGLFDKVITETGLNDPTNALLSVDWQQIALALTAGGASLAIFTIGAGGLGAAFWTAIILIIGVFFSIFSGLITIGLRQIVVTLLIAISPLAFVAYLLPNTEKWFDKWKSLLAQMIFFYPIFATLFNASKLAGLTIIGSSNGEITKVIVGLAVQVLPLFLSISLLKMSGTILGKVSSGLDKAFGHAATPLQGWALSHHEQNKQRYLAQNMAPGAKLRNFLARRQALREMNTLDNKENVTNRAIEGALNKRASYLGTGKDGKPIWGTRIIGPVKWKNHANSYTRAAARSHVQKLSTTGAQSRLMNSLSDHGSLFAGKKAKRLSSIAANAFEELTVQEFWKENIAQNDQEYLINRYLSATNRKLPNHKYNYNRLIASAAGSFGYKGEKTIMAQVVKRSADIESKRRAEAAIMINKFGYNKEFRNMMFNRRRLNDNGVALDANLDPVEDATNFRPLKGKIVEEWHKYIYVDEHNKEIDRTKGDKMSAEQLKKKGIRKVRYADITDDDENVVSRVYEDDAGYVKEMIMNDMLISDPIARRYATEIGLPRPESVIKNDPVAAQFAKENAEKGKGMLRRYRTSIVGALQASGYSEHNAAYTAMLLAQLNGGNINSIEQLNLAEMMSFNASGKSGKLLLNDGIYYDNSRRLLSCFMNDENFKKYLGNEAVALYGDQNFESLNGLRLGTDENGNPKWIPVNHTSPDITLDDKKNYIWHKVFPKYVKKVIGSLGRRPSPNVLDGMKPENAKPLLDLLQFAMQLAEQNADQSIPFEQRLDGNMDLFEDTDPNCFKDFVDQGRKRAEAIKKGLNPETANARRQSSLNRFIQHVRNTNPTEVSEQIESILSDEYIDRKSACDLLQSYCAMNPLLTDHLPEIQEMAERYLYGGEVGDDKTEVAHNLARDSYTREQFINDIRSRFL